VTVVSVTVTAADATAAAVTTAAVTAAAVTTVAVTAAAMSYSSLDRRDRYTRTPSSPSRPATWPPSPHPRRRAPAQPGNLKGRARGPTISCRESLV
jgi:hypothetical protein